MTFSEIKEAHEADEALLPRNRLGKLNHVRVAWEREAELIRLLEECVPCLQSLLDYGLDYGNEVGFHRHDVKKLLNQLTGKPQ